MDIILIPLSSNFNREKEQETQKEERLMEEKKKKKQEEKKKKEGAQKKVCLEFFVPCPSVSSRCASLSCHSRSLSEVPFITFQIR